MPAIPALSRGLHLLESLAQASQPLGFAELFTRLGMPRASLARTLAALHEAGWIERSGTAGWRLAGRLHALIAPADPAARLLARARPVLRALRDRLDATVLLAVPRAAGFTVLAVDQAEEGIASQADRTVDDLARGPWGGLVFAHLDAAEQVRVLQRCAAPDRARLDAMLRQFRRAGFISDPGRGRPNILRLGVPVRAGPALAAILGVLAPLGQFRDLPALAGELTNAARRLEDES